MHVFRCTGWRGQLNILGPSAGFKATSFWDSGKQHSQDHKYPAMTSYFESSVIPGLYFAGVRFNIRLMAIQINNKDLQ